MNEILIKNEFSFLDEVLLIDRLLQNKNNIIRKYYL